MPQSTAEITISICTYERYDVLPKAIESAAQQSLPKARYKIIVVDNSPNQERAAAFAKRFAAVPNLTYTLEQTPGLSNARNVSARLCGTHFIAFMDDDAVANPDWLVEILRAFEQFGPSAAVVGGRVDPLWAAARPPWLHDNLLGNVSVVNWGGETRIAKPTEWFAGTNISFRTNTIIENGGFATNLGRIGSGASLLSNEEIDLLRRIQEKKGRLIYAPSAKVDHLVEEKRLTRDWFRKRAAWQAVSDFMMDPKKVPSSTQKHWKGVIQYFNQLPPHLRTVNGLIYDTDDPELFRQQLGVYYTFVSAILTGFDGITIE